MRQSEPSVPPLSDDDLIEGQKIAEAMAERLATFLSAEFDLTGRHVQVTGNKRL